MRFKRLIMDKLIILIGILFLMMGFSVLILGSLLLYGEWSLMSLVEDLYSNIGTGLLTVAVTILLIDRIYAHHRKQEHKSNLILQMSSPNNAFAVEASRQLRVRGWLSDGSLNKSRLAYADLSKAQLKDINLREADLSYAKLVNADLRQADLRRAVFFEADLSGAVLTGANLEGADLLFANLEGTVFEDFIPETEYGDEIQITLGNKLDFKLPLERSTILPDGTKYTNKTNLRKFTDPSYESK